MSKTAEKLLIQDFNKIKSKCDNLSVPTKYSFINQVKLTKPESYFNWSIQVQGCVNTRFDGFAYNLIIHFSKRYPCKFDSLLYISIT